MIAEPGTLDTATRDTASALGEAGVPVAAITPLEHDANVIQFSLASNDRDAVRTLLDTHFGASDGLIVDRPPTAPSLFVSDMDSTMIGQECIDELADYAGLKDRIAPITERAMRGELDFEAALRERVALLVGLEERAIDACLAERITPAPGARTLLGTLKERGCRTVLVTGGFHHFADRVGAMLGFDRIVGNRLGVADGRLTGSLTGAICDAATKRSVLLEEAANLGDAAVTMAAGDGANDAAMLRAADLGFACHGKPAAREAANGWIDRGDLTAILRLLEISRSDWVAASD